MFLKNAWHCAGWDYELSHGKNSLLTRQIAGEHLVLYRTHEGKVIAMEDRCPHRQAALSLGVKEGDSLRCMYHGMRFGPDGKCTDVPGQEVIPPKACVRTLPVVEQNNWIWVWMGAPEKVDPSLICFSVGPGDTAWNIKTSKVMVKANYRLEIANLMDLSHLTWVHRATFGGTDMYTRSGAKHTITSRGVDTRIRMKKVPAPVFAQHMFPPGAVFDLEFDVQMTVPCNFILHFRILTPGTVVDGDSDGQLVLDSYSCQAITPRNADEVDYYYSWGPSKATDMPGMADMLYEAITAAFLEDKEMLELQHLRKKERPDGNLVDTVHDAGPGKLLWLLDKLLKEEAGSVSKIPVVAQVA